MQRIAVPVVGRQLQGAISLRTRREHFINAIRHSIISWSSIDDFDCEIMKYRIYTLIVENLLFASRRMHCNAIDRQPIFHKFSSFCHNKSKMQWCCFADDISLFSLYCRVKLLWWGLSLHKLPIESVIVRRWAIYVFSLMPFFISVKKKFLVFSFHRFAHCWNVNESLI